jgi:hypothetical protein
MSFTPASRIFIFSLSPFFALSMYQLEDGGKDINKPNGNAEQNELETVPKGYLTTSLMSEPIIEKKEILMNSNRRRHKEREDVLAEKKGAYVRANSAIFPVFISEYLSNDRR